MPFTLTLAQVHDSHTESQPWKIRERAQDCFTDDRRVRVINLALANSITYQNFIALNKWGHALHPDLILSFSGINDVTVPMDVGCDLPYRFQGVMGLTRSTWITEGPQFLKDMGRYYPSLEKSLLGVSIRVLVSPQLGKKAATEYAMSHSTSKPPSASEYILKLYVHALKSIKRDFQGIPMVIAFQPHYRQAPIYQQPLVYLVSQAPKELQGYLNDQWFFFDLQEYFRENNLLNEESMVGGVHLLNRGHEGACAFLAKELIPIMRKLRPMP